MNHLNSKLLTQALGLAGWKLDKYGYPCKQVGTDFLRVRMDRDHCEIERRIYKTPTVDSPSRTGWKRVAQAYYREVSITDSCQINMGTGHLF